MHVTAHAPSVGSVLSDPSQPLTTVGEELDDLRRS